VSILYFNRVRNLSRVFVAIGFGCAFFILLGLMNNSSERISESFSSSLLVVISFICFSLAYSLKVVVKDAKEYINRNIG